MKKKKLAKIMNELRKTNKKKERKVPKKPIPFFTASIMGFGVASIPRS